MLTRPQRTSLLLPDRKDPALDVWKSKSSDRRIDEVAELPTQKEDVQLLDPTSLERLVDFECGLGWSLRQDILAIRTVVLRDGCVIGLKLQHPFGDANGIVYFDEIFPSGANERCLVLSHDANSKGVLYLGGQKVD